MCGICGFNFPDKGLVRVMTDRLAHRGPDAQDVFVDSRVSLGHRRLAILDLHPRGKNPLWNDEGTRCIIHNGEVYNYQGLRAELEEAGVSFRTETDTEVVLKAVERWGPAAVERFNGMFAFAVYDAPSGELLLARDRLGIKPLYYHWDGRKFLFASEIKALLAALPAALDPQALAQYLSFRCVPGERTAFAGIRKVPPGHLLMLRGGALELRSYWHLQFKPHHGSLTTNAAKLLELLKDSVRLQLRSDVPLGVYLSGGLDSSAIVALASTHAKLKTFTVSFDNQSEAESARRVAEEFGTEHRELHATGDAVALLSKVAYHLDEPLGDAASIPTYLMSQLTRKHVTVVLSGEGGDEIMAGYARYLPQIYMNKLGYLPKWSRMVAAMLAPPTKTLQRGAQALAAAEDPAQLYLGGVEVFSESERRDLLAKPLAASAFSLRPYFGNHAFLNGLLAIDTKEWLPNRLLLKGDKMTMAHSLEGRVPLLDHRLVEFAASLPLDQKLRGLTTKYLWRKTLSGILPREILARRKQGFSVPLREWLRDGLKSYAEDLVETSEHGLFRRDEAQRIVGSATRSIYHTRQFWTLLFFEEWHRAFLGEKKV